MLTTRYRVYSSGTKYMKDPGFFQTSGGISEALPALVDPDYHRQRRKMINSLFSTKSIEHLSTIVLDVIRRALNKAVEANQKSKPLDVQKLYTGVTVGEPAGIPYLANHQD
jgi:cytochrome P450